jgi:hypothetical protein
MGLINSYLESRYFVEKNLEVPREPHPGHQILSIGRAWGPFEQMRQTCIILKAELVVYRGAIFPVRAIENSSTVPWLLQGAY